MATQPAITGLSQLGAVLADAGQTYARRETGLQDEARRRAALLQDVESQRAYEGQRYDRGRADQLSDYERNRADQDQALWEARVWESTQTLARMDAQQRAQVVTGLVSQGLLSPDKMNDPAAVSAAYATLQGRLESTRTNTQAYVDRITAEEAVVRQQLGAVEAELNAPPPAIDPRAVQQRALELARQQKGGGTPSRQEIDAQIPAVTEELQNAAATQWYQSKENARVQYQLLNARLNNLSQAKRQFNVPPSAAVLNEPVATVAPATPSGPALADAAARSAAALSVAGVSPAAAPQAMETPAAAAPVQLLESPVEDPIITAANERRIAQGQANAARLFDTDFSDLNQELNAVQSRQQAIRAGVNPNPFAFSGGIDPVTGATAKLSPDEQAALLTESLIQEAAIDKKRRELLTRQGLPAATQMLEVGAPASVASRYGL